MVFNYLNKDISTIVEKRDARIKLKLKVNRALFKLSQKRNMGFPIKKSFWRL